jgi:glutathione S-transferase
MKLYDYGRAPNARRVRTYLAEKGITVPTEMVDLATMQHKSDAYTAVNPMQRVPVLELDDGTVIAESMAICRYFEALNPERRCSAPAPSNWHRSRCGTALPNSTCSFRYPRFSVICTRA